MESIIVERAYEVPADLEGMSRVEASIAWCYEQRSVEFVRSFMSPDLRRFVCLYRAPDAEAVRAVQRTANFTYERAWTAHVIGSDTIDIVDCVVVERVLEEPITAADAATAVDGASHVVSHLSRDGLRLTSVYAPGDPPAIAAPVRVQSERRWAAKCLGSS